MTDTDTFAAACEQDAGLPVTHWRALRSINGRPSSGKPIGDLIHAVGLRDRASKMISGLTP